MHRLIASPYNGPFLIARPGSKGGIHISRTLYEGPASTTESSNPLPTGSSTTPAWPGAWIWRAR